MADNRDLTGGQDRDRVAAGQEHEVAYLAKKLNVSVDEVKQAIETVGNDRDKVEEYLRKGRP